MNLDTLIGGIAAICTTCSYFPQLRKCWQTGSAGDLSLKTFGVLAFGVGLWVVYGVMRTDWIITISNGISFTFLTGILALKVRERRNHEPLAHGNRGAI